METFKVGDYVKLKSSKCSDRVSLGRIIAITGTGLLIVRWYREGGVFFRNPSDYTKDRLISFHPDGDFCYKPDRLEHREAPVHMVTLQPVEQRNG